MRSLVAVCLWITIVVFAVLIVGHDSAAIASALGMSRLSKGEVSLLGYWTFDEGGGNSAVDISMFGNHGQIFGGSYVQGRFGYGLELDGLDDFVDLGNPSELNPASALTIEAWCLPLAAAASCGTTPIVDKGYYDHTDPFYQYHLSLGSGGNGNEVLIFGHPNGAHGGTWIQGEWVHIAATYGEKWSKLYVNGQIVDSQFHDIYDGLMTDYGKNVYFGKLGNLSSCFLNAIIDEVRIYGRALTSDEIALHFAPKSGDIDGSNRTNISDVVYLVNYIFTNGPRPYPYLWLADVDCDQSISIADCVSLINYIFGGGPAPCEP